MNTNYFLNLIAGNVFGVKAEPSLPARYYLGLSATAPTVDGVCTGEPSSPTCGYARIPLDSLSEPMNGTVSNKVAIDFSESLESWGTMSHYVVYDSATGGNLLFYGALAVSLTVDPGTIVTIKAGELSIRLCSTSE